MEIKEQLTSRRIIKINFLILLPPVFLRHILLYFYAVAPALYIALFWDHNYIK